jgi:regulator of RNase E activity RraB
MSDLPTYEYKLTSKADPAWNFYRSTLLPGEDSRQLLQDRLVVEKLKENNDDLSKPRPVDHLTYFRSKKDREEFVVEIEKMRFTVTKRFDGEGDFPFAVEFTKSQPVILDIIHPVVLFLKRLAEKHNGEYDGWGTQVVPKQK